MSHLYYDETLDEQEHSDLSPELKHLIMQKIHERMNDLGAYYKHCDETELQIGSYVQDYITDWLGVAIPICTFILALVHQPPMTYYLLAGAGGGFVLELARRRQQKRKKKKWIIATRKRCGGARGVPSFEDYEPDLEGCGRIDTPEFRIEGKAHEIAKLDYLRRLLILEEMRFSMRYGTELYKDGILLDVSS